MLSLLLLIAVCSDSDTLSEELDPTETRDTVETPGLITDADFEATDWTEESHSKELDLIFIPADIYYASKQ